MSTNEGAGDAQDTSNEGDEGAADEGAEDVTPTKGETMDEVADNLIGEEENEEGQDEGDDSDESESDDDESDSDGDEGDDDTDDESDEEDSDDDDSDDSEDEDQEEDDESDDEEDSSEDSEEIDLDNVDHYNIKEDKQYGIAPIKIPKEFEKNKSVVALHDAIINNAMQAFKNVVGLANKQNVQVQAQNAAAEAKQSKAWMKEIDTAVKGGDIPEYERLTDGRIDANSEGGKVISEVLAYMNDHNEKNPESPIKSFEVARKLYNSDKTVQDKKKSTENGKKTRRKKGSMIGGAGSKGATKPKFSDVPTRGTSLDDINDGLDL